LTALEFQTAYNKISTDKDFSINFLLIHTALFVSGKTVPQDFVNKGIYSIEQISKFQ